MATTTAELVTVGAFVVLVYPFLSAWGINGVAATVSIAETMGLGALLLAMRQADRGAPRAAARAAT